MTDEEAERPAGSGATPGDLARTAMQAALRSARANPATERRRRVAGPRREHWSSAGPDATDPQPFGTLVNRLVDDRGWTDQAREGALFGRWADLVGPQIAAHSHPSQLHEGELLVVADSSAWATQLRLLVPKLQARLADELGSKLVSKIRVQGPVAPTQNPGPATGPRAGPARHLRLTAAVRVKDAFCQ